MKWTDTHRKILWICLTPLLPVIIPVGYCIGQYKTWEGKRHNVKYRTDTKYRAKFDVKFQKK